MTCRCLNGPLGEDSCLRCGRSVAGATPDAEHEGWSVLLQTVLAVGDGMERNVAISRAGTALGTTEGRL